MTRHIESVHEGRKAFKCDICDHSFTHKYKLKGHIESVHEGKKEFKCDICDQSFSKKYHFKRHMASIHEGKQRSKWNYVLKALVNFMKQNKHSNISFVKKLMSKDIWIILLKSDFKILEEIHNVTGIE